MGAITTNTVVELFKKVYGNITDLLGADFKLQKMLSFSEKQRVGDQYLEAVVLTAETGITMGGSGMDAFDINPAIAGSVRQAAVTPYTSVLASVVPWGVLSRSANGGDQAFMDATKHVVKNHLKSHSRFAEIARWYGQNTYGLGRVSYATATYRNVALTNGGGTVGGVAFTAGVNTSSKAILMAPGDFAAGIWVGMEGVVIEEIATASGLVVAQGKMVGVDAENGILYVDFTPVAASSTTSHKLGFQGMAAAKEMVGVKKILSTSSGNLFGVPVANYSLWKGVTKPLSNEKLKFQNVSDAIALCVNRGGLGGDGNGDIELFLNPRSFSTLITTEAGKRVFDKSYSSSKAEEGSEAIQFFSENGKITINSYRMIMEGDCFGLHLGGDWSRSGSSEISFKIPGGLSDRDVIYPLENQAAYAFRSFSDQYIFCHAPARSFLITGVNDESAS